jgi:hypothetical protein
MVDGWPERRKEERREEERRKSNDVWCVKRASLGSAMPAGAEVYANDADVFASEMLATEGAGGRETGRGLGNDLFATA